MDEIIYTLLTLLAGLSIGLVFFGGLWYTVQKSVNSKVPGLLFLASFIFRISIALFSFYYVSLGQWHRLAICLFGFIIGRL